MLGFHVVWSRPRAESFAADGPDAQPFGPLELLSAALSAALWRHHHGSCRLYTDALGRAWLARKGLESVWDEVDDTLLEGVPPAVRAPVFWDIAKVFILARLEEPAVALDLDLLVWEPFEMVADVQVLHFETASPPWYVERVDLRTTAGYRFDPAWDWNTDAANTALLASRDPAYSRELWAQALRFALGAAHHAGQAEFLFAVQRLVPLVAKGMGRSIASVLEYRHDPNMPFDWDSWRSAEWRVDLPFSPFLSCTHLWMLKHVLAERLDWRVGYVADLLCRFTARVPRGDRALPVVARLRDECVGVPP